MGSITRHLNFIYHIPPQTQQKGQDKEKRREGKIYQVIFKDSEFNFFAVLLTLSTHGLKAAASGVWKVASSP